MGAVVEEFQPTLSRATIERNWFKIVQIYQAHAERVAQTHIAAPIGTAQQRGSPTPQPVSIPAPAAESEDEVVAQLKGVIDFIDRPLSPRTLQNIKQLKRQQLDNS